MSDFFAIDIGRKSIKLVQATHEKDGSASMNAIGAIDFPQNLPTIMPEKSDEQKVDLLASVIKNLVESSKVKVSQVVTSIPENIIFSKLTTIPLVDPAKLEQTIYWEAKQFVPIPLEEAQMDWIEVRRTLPTSKNGQIMVDVIIIAAPRKIIEDYLNVFEKADIELIAVEVESVSTARAIKFNYPDIQGTNLFVDMGFDKTNVGVMYNGKLIYSQSIANGSNALTKVIAADFGLQMDQADQYKIAYGLLANGADKGKIANSIQPIVNLIGNEIKRIVGFVNTRLNFGSMKKVYLTGGGSSVPGMTQYIQSLVGIPAQLVDPFANFKFKGDFVNVRNEFNIASFGLATGLALKDE
jgi:type IV pilus assembly protein PilM